MKIIVHVKLHKHRDEVIEVQKGIYEVHTSQPPIDNRANEDVIRQLAAYFHIPKSACTLVSGGSSKTKTFDIRS